MEKTHENTRQIVLQYIRPGINALVHTVEAIKHGHRHRHEHNTTWTNRHRGY